ncbi:MAG: AAA family ATPase [Candidatus Micrarchaeota archaeon]|nr:AAA family ATPase [Candidatus Micrarchaeota archaeon]
MPAKGADGRRASPKAKMPNLLSGSEETAGSVPEDVDGTPQKHQRYTHVPLSFYWLKDVLRQFVSHENFPDALAIVFSAASIAIAFPFFPYVILIPLLIGTFVLTLLSPLLGLMGLLFETLLMFMYQAPLLAWVMTLFISVALFLGYKHYRSITFVYTLSMLPLSFLGSFLELPAFIIGVLYIGYRRAMISVVAILVMLSILSGVTGVALNGPFIYDGLAAHAAMSSNPAVQFMAPSMRISSLLGFPDAVSGAFGDMVKPDVASNIYNAFDAVISAVIFNLPLRLIEMAVWLVVVSAMTMYVINSRSAYKGTVASLFSVILLANYAVLSYVSNSSFDYFVVFGFIAAPIVIFFLEFNNIGVVKALEVMKKDFLGKFGEAFEDLTSGSRETLDDVADYEETKKELREAILAPIEHREISGAYNIKPAKGILLFGPPGTGKTMLMRAIANELRARFFYVKTSSLLSPYMGESSQTLSRIFATAKKHAPAVLFFDEIDGIAGNRELQTAAGDRQLLSTLLSEMDGFQKIEGVVIVGSTNVPNLLDPSILRPGRFDKIIYMELPDKDGREKIFRHYLRNLPVSKSVDFDKLTSLTNRYTGADIKNVCEEAARKVADEAVKEAKVLQMNTADLLNVIKITKPSTSLSRIDQYNTFKMDYERRTHPEMLDRRESTISIDDVIGLESAKKALYEAVEVPILHPNLVKKYDVPETKGILLFGPPGTGKTMLMRAIANELGDVHMVILSGADVSRLGLERAVFTVKETFNRAKENAPAIVFIDEIDALLPGRDSASELGVGIVGEFLQEFDGIKPSSGIVVVGVTNRPDQLDSAMLRGGRFDRLIFVAPPGKDDREQLFKHYLRKVALSDDVDFEKLASMTVGYTGADIANVCRQCKMSALEKDLSTAQESKITMKELLKALDTIRPSAPESVLGRYINFLALHGGK